MEFVGEAKKWGGSLAVVIPREVIEAEGVKEGDELDFKVKKLQGFHSLFGAFPSKTSGQKLKDEARKGWA
ncbi:AbrB/MazE/SpoVT family DNA-binding domain-containing protein [Candidatus Micrarchaeota archaeon]|nr:AbrB/MazE/SpoVT family DNA-binding domain-containing protein [Candidatus Micrarchaeota archaeon]